VPVFAAIGFSERWPVRPSAGTGMADGVADSLNYSPCHYDGMIPKISGFAKKGVFRSFLVEIWRLGCGNGWFEAVFGLF